MENTIKQVKMDIPEEVVEAVTTPTKNTKMSMVKDFVHAHKKELLIGGGMLLVGGVYFAVKHINSTKHDMQSETDIAFPLDRLSIGTLNGSWFSSDSTNLIVDDIKVKDLGALGTSVKEALDISDEDNAGVLLTVLGKHNIR